MCEEFLKVVNELYSLILQPLDITYKKIGINNYRKLLKIDDNQSLSQEYGKLREGNKERGIIYTPEEISNFIVENTITEKEIVENPYIKIVDPSCGCGNIIIPCFTYLRKLYLLNLDIINEKHNINLTTDNLNRHIIDNNIFGFDIDEEALKVLIIDLYTLSGYVNRENFIQKDFLLDDIDEKFDVFIGNPPYVGHKSIDGTYSKTLKNIYKGIYKDKGDISYCFFKRAIDIMQCKGKLSFITSRYFLESQSGEELRKTLKEKSSLVKIVDFYGIRPFKNAGVDPTIIFLENKKLNENKVEIIKPLSTKANDKKDFYNSLFLNKKENYKGFTIQEEQLDDKGWVLISGKERQIIEKINLRSFDALGGICDSYQGIITGCDKAFVVDEDIIFEENIERDIIKPWIKNSYVQKNKVAGENKFLIYSNLIDKEEKYPNSIRYISKYKEKLQNRRECKKGLRKWYELQWGRKKEIFEMEKIIFPYKSNSNRFALDTGSYYSADVYSLVLKQVSRLNYQYILYILNSKLYEFYFKTFGKKLGEDLFEYYPNKVMELRIPYIEQFSGNENDEFLYDYFGLTKEEIDIVESKIKV